MSSEDYMVMPPSNVRQEDLYPHLAQMAVLVTSLPMGISYISDLINLLIQGMRDTYVSSSEMASRPIRQICNSSHFQRRFVPNSEVLESAVRTRVS